MSARNDTLLGIIEIDGGNGRKLLVLREDGGSFVFRTMDGQYNRLESVTITSAQAQELCRRIERTYDGR